MGTHAPTYPPNVGFYNEARPPFQQNPDNTEVELAADMFLNWVYRKLGKGGFENRTWAASSDSDFPDPVDESNSKLLTCAQYWLGCPDPTNPGNARFEWMEGKMKQLTNFGSNQP